MTPVKKISVITIFMVVAIGGLYAYKEYHRKAADLSTAKVDETINATDMVAAFEKNEAEATKKFAGKTVLVTGNVSEIENQQDTIFNIFLGDETAISKVSCLLDVTKKDAFKNISVGKKISVKGICNGFLADVEMNRCIIVNEK